jgi:DNA-binding MarR family transcriptional regulator
MLLAVRHLTVLALARSMRRHLAELYADEAWMQDLGFRSPCAGVLRTVAEAGPLSQRQISDEVGLDPSDVVGAVDILETAGLVERHRDPDDRRRHAVMVTPEGAKAADRLRELMVEAEDRTLANLTPDEREQLVDLLEKALAG